MRGIDPWSAEYARHYRRGWDAYENEDPDADDSEGNATQRADARNEPSAWYDGYGDALAGWRKYAAREAARRGLGCPDVLPEDWTPIRRPSGQ
jgi:hypothetical protein